MALPVWCRACSARYIIDENAAEEPAQCKHCGGPITICGPAAAPPRSIWRPFGCPSAEDEMAALMKVAREVPEVTPAPAPAPESAPAPAPPPPVPAPRMTTINAMMPMVRPVLRLRSGSGGSGGCGYPGVGVVGAIG